jgi:Hg(II)-responsive transcriptional regulator
MNLKEKGMTIKKVAGQAGVGIETIRFYERKGLIPEPPRTKSGYRQYSPDAVTRLRFIKRAQGLGFSLPEIKELLFLKVTRNASAAEVRKRAAIKIEEINSRIKSLEQIRNVLKNITSSCHGRGSANECPILMSIDQDLIGMELKGKKKIEKIKPDGENQ